MPASHPYMPTPPVRSGAVARPQGAMFDLGAATHTGRRADNQDHYLIADLDHGLRVRRTSLGRHNGTESGGVYHRLLMIVADGVGGHWGGEQASAAVLREVAANLAVVPTGAEDHAQTTRALRHQLDLSLRRADQRVRAMSVDERSGGPATTATAVCVEWPVLLLAHVGDSRAYVMRGDRLHRLTSDHTVAEAIRACDGNPPEHFEHILTNAIGGHDEATPDLRSMRLREGDTLLLCTDGVSGPLSDEQLEAQLRAVSTADSLAQRLIESAYQEGSKDNMTAVVVRVR